MLFKQLTIHAGEDTYSGQIAQMTGLYEAILIQLGEWFLCQEHNPVFVSTIILYYYCGHIILSH